MITPTFFVMILLMIIKTRDIMKAPMGQVFGPGIQTSDHLPPGLILVGGLAILTFTPRVIQGRISSLNVMMSAGGPLQGNISTMINPLREILDLGHLDLTNDSLSLIEHRDLTDPLNSPAPLILTDPMRLTRCAMEKTSGVHRPFSTEMTPHQILNAPMLSNGGLGTRMKGETDSHLPQAGQIFIPECQILTLVGLVFTTYLTPVEDCHYFQHL